MTQCDDHIRVGNSRTGSFATIRYGADCIDEARAAITPHIVKWSHLIPTWCHEINVCWHDSTDTAALAVTVHYEYRRADLTVYPNFFTCPDRQEGNVIHELLHIMLAPMMNVAADLRDATIKANPALEQWAVEQIRLANESVTCDLTNLIRSGARND